MTTPAPFDLITATIAGRTFRCTRRTAAHLEWTIERLAKEHPGARLVIIQTCYNTGVDASEGTHDYDAVFDFYIDGLGWWDAQRFMRRHGWFGWYRYTGPWADMQHLHMGSLPPNGRTFPQKVGEYIDGGRSLTGRVYTSSQLDDYWRKSLGLAGQHESGLDDSWYPPDIAATIFDYDAYLEDDMADAATQKILNDTLATAKQTLKEVRAFRKGRQESDRKVKALLTRIVEQGADDATRSQAQKILADIKALEESVNQEEA